MGGDWIKDRIPCSLNKTLIIHFKVSTVFCVLVVIALSVMSCTLTKIALNRRAERK